MATARQESVWYASLESELSYPQTWSEILLADPKYRFFLLQYERKRMFCEVGRPNVGIILVLPKLWQLREQCRGAKQDKMC